MTSPRCLTPITLKSGLVLKNRCVKAAMEENLANASQLPDQRLYNLYHAWAKGGVGLIITGNVMVDDMAMTGPGGVVLDKSAPIEPFIQWAKIARENDTKVVMQINHPGRQVFKRMQGKNLSPSDVPLDMGKHSSLFEAPTPMTESDIQDVISRFTDTALKAKQAGFDGVQIHAAHGYLLAQFLSPLTNKRSDHWGGDLQGRAKLLLDIVTAVKNACGGAFSVSVKLNSADFQRGGFDIDDAKQVAKWLDPMELDFIELSGGSYEAPAMQGRTADNRTLAREAYFLTFAQDIQQHITTPVMTTGGISRLQTTENVVQSGIALAGMATALATTPDLVNRWQSNPDFVSVMAPVSWKDKTLAGLATMAKVKRNLRRLSQGKAASTDLNSVLSLILDQVRTAKLTKRYKRRHTA